MPAQGPAEKKVDWQLAKKCLAVLQTEARPIVEQGVIIGGIACWFYRHLLTKAADPDFKVPNFSPAQEALWLSKDVDFTNFFAEDARQLLPERLNRDVSGRVHLEISGIPIGFAQVGITFDPESAWADSWIASFTDEGRTIQCRVLDPISLYIEKLALTQRRGSPSDQMHCSVVAEFLRYETCTQAATLIAAQNLEARTTPLRFILSLKNRAPEVARDHRLAARIHRLLETAPQIAPSEMLLLRGLSATAGFDQRCST
jgi:hypothetical protein